MLVRVRFLLRKKSDRTTSPAYMIISIINLVHIFSSYVAFKNMNAGVAITIFYIYPVFNLLFKSYLTHTKLNFGVLKYIIFSLVCVGLISFQSMSEDQTKNSYFIGLLAILVAALTESLTYTFYKSESKMNPFDGIFTLYLFGTILMLFFAPKFLEANTKINKNNIVELVMFNIFIGLVGHIFRFYGIPRTTTDVYSVYLFIGVVSAYIFGWYFLKEKLRYII
ncbi:permease [Tupanvirus soda lake]|uniref:Permease n=2 Tax=Tupanvirus TaxID=2094720 RepID=A0A6N1NIP3_9VIRU|nr:permease [Tupanvirus soda lake]QKU34775.1 permease [Tupanvirus soda lake]